MRPAFRNDVGKRDIVPFLVFEKIFLLDGARIDQSAQFRDSVVVGVVPNIELVILDLLHRLGSRGIVVVDQITATGAFFIVLIARCPGNRQAVDQITVISHRHKVRTALAHVDASERAFLDAHGVRMDKQLLGRDGAEACTSVREALPDFDIVDRRRRRALAFNVNHLDALILLKHGNVIIADQLHQCHFIKAGAALPVRCPSFRATSG